MKISVLVLTLSLFYLCVAEAQHNEHQAEDCSSTKTHNIELSYDCVDDSTGSQEDDCQSVVIIRKLEAELENTETQSEELSKEVQDNPEAFEAIGESIGDDAGSGPFHTEITLTSHDDFSNTGIFTAPVKGVYYFSFSGQYVSARPLGLRLMMNREQMVNAVGSQPKTATNSMTLPLEKGDQVYMRLRSINIHIRIHIRIRFFAK